MVVSCHGACDMFQPPIFWSEFAQVVLDKGLVNGCKFYRYIVLFFNSFSFVVYFLHISSNVLLLINWIVVPLVICRTT